MALAMSVRALRSAALAFAVMATAAGAAAAGDPAGVVIVSPTPLTITVAHDTPAGTGTLVAFNGSAVDRTIGVALLSVTGADGQPAPPGTVVVSGPQQVKAAAFSLPFTITVTRTGPAAATYTGKLIVTSSDGTIVQADATITFDGPPLAAATARPDALRPPLPDKVPQSADNLLPSPVTRLLRWISQQPGPIACITCWLVETANPAVEIPVTPALAAAASPAILVADDGSRAVAQPSGNVVRVAGISAAGEYNGKLSFGKDVSTSLSVSVRDLVIWPAIVLFLGIWLADQVDERLSRRFPRDRLRVALQKLKEQAVRDLAGAERVPSDPVRPRYAIWDGPRDGWVDLGTGVLAVRANDALREFEDAADPATAISDWATSGTRFKAIDTLVSDYQQLLGHTDALATLLADLESLVGPEWTTEFQAQPVVTGAREAIGGSLLETQKTFDDAVTGVADASRLMKIFINVYKVLSSWAADQENSVEHRAGLRDLLGQMRTGRHTDTKPLEDLRVAANAFAPPGGGLEASGPAANADSGPAAEGPAAAIQRKPVNVAETLAAIQRADRHTTYVAGALVLLTGLVATYYAKATFGSIPDYLAAFLWGSTVSGAITIARRLGAFSPRVLGRA